MAPPPPGDHPAWRFGRGPASVEVKEAGKSSESLWPVPLPRTGDDDFPFPLFLDAGHRVGHFWTLDKWRQPPAVGPRLRSKMLRIRTRRCLSFVDGAGSVPESGVAPAARRSASRRDGRESGRSSSAGAPEVSPSSKRDAINKLPKSHTFVKGDPS